MGRSDYVCIIDGFAVLKRKMEGIIMQTTEPTDARLLAAAPELLRALQWMQLIIDTHGPQTSWGVAARQIAEIIAKVEGRDVAEPSGESEVA